MEVGAQRRLEVLGTKGTLVIESPGGTQARLHLEAAAGGFQAGWQTVDGGDWTGFRRGPARSRGGHPRRADAAVRSGA